MDGLFSSPNDLAEDWAGQCDMEDMAREFGRSLSGFHHHYRAITAMSALQFQKQLRLQEARRLMLAEGLDAVSAITAWGTETLRTSPASISGSARRRCTMSNSCGKAPGNRWRVKE